MSSLLRSPENWSVLHASHELDLAFVVDCTMSMSRYIAVAKRKIQDIVEKISRNAYSVRFALIKYRDHPPQDESFVVRCEPFTHSCDTIEGCVGEMEAAGGGDPPDAVADGLYKALNLDYRQRATKICIWIGDARPHGLHEADDQIPEGCPNNHDPVAICHEMARKGIILYCVGCEPSLRIYRDFFMGLSLITGGQYIRLARARILPQVIVRLTCEEVENENLMGLVEDHINLRYIPGARVPLEAVDRLVNSLHEELRLNNNRTRRIRFNAREIEPFTDLAKRISFMHTLADVAVAFQAEVVIEQPVQNERENVEITDLDEVSPQQCVRLVRRAFARNPHRQIVVIDML